MRGTSSREDATSWGIRLDNKKEDFATLGANFISRFTKYRGTKMVLDYEWTFKPDPADPVRMGDRVRNKQAKSGKECSGWIAGPEGMRYRARL
jgi:hypothetical protein